MSLVINIFKNHKKKFLRLKTIEKAVKRTLKKFKVKKANINLILTDDISVKELNKKFLNHNYETDVLAFRLEDEELDGEIYISIDTAERQSKDYKVSLTNELARLAIHGTLHLIGYKDDTKQEKAEMHKIEDEILLKL
ncbi:MAG: rRNA maturation RNase YbeY [Candidatus Kapabacteria bacterium]|nr:rRNA maturation RNase YbeY [Candidatus Kapabacteria bacterium]